MDLGLSAVLAATAAAFIWLKWLGVANSLFLGVSVWRWGVAELDKRMPSRAPSGSLFWQGLMLAMINPKTLIFNAAFLPQFLHRMPDQIGFGIWRGACIGKWKSVTEARFTPHISGLVSG